MTKLAEYKAKLRHKSEEMTETVVDKVLVVGTSAALGYLQGYKNGMPEIGGVGIDLAIGVTASALGLFSHELKIGKYGKYLDSVGSGALAFWGANQGHMYGVKKAGGSNDWPDQKAPASSGYLPPGMPGAFLPPGQQVPMSAHSRVPFGYQ